MLITGRDPTSKNSGFRLDEFGIVEEDEPPEDVSVDVDVFDDELAGNVAPAAATLLTNADSAHIVAH